MTIPTSIVRAGLLAFTLCSVYGQKPLSFDAASIKPYSGPGGGRRVPEGAAPTTPIGGGGLRFMPGRVVSAPIGVSVRKIILEAYQLSQSRLSGGPGWLDS